MKTLFAILAIAAAGTAMAANVAWVTPSGGTITASKGDTFGSLTLPYNMPTGNPASYTFYNDALKGKVNIGGGNFFANGYTVSLWLTTTQLESGKVLFAYAGDNASSDDYGANGIVWNSDNTITIGRGKYATQGTTTSAAVFTFGTNTTEPDKATSSAITLSSSASLINLTFSVACSGGMQTTTIWVNGGEIETLTSYKGNMNGGNANTRMNLYLDPATTYGWVAITNEALTTAEQIAALATVPEPTTATLSLLALAGLMARRRRRVA